MTDYTQELTLLGAQRSKAITDWQEIETFPCPEGVGFVRLISDELTSVCPKTGQPDFQTIEIEYDPHQRCIESKALKLYLMGFREQGHFCEALAAKIARELRQAAEAQWVSVTIRQKPRGGIAIEAHASAGEPDG